MRSDKGKAPIAQSAEHSAYSIARYARVVGSNPTGSIFERSGESGRGERLKKSREVRRGKGVRERGKEKEKCREGDRKGISRERSWSKGRMLPSQGSDPGSSPGGRIFEKGKSEEKEQRERREERKGGRREGEGNEWRRRGKKRSQPELNRCLPKNIHENSKNSKQMVKGDVLPSGRWDHSRKRRGNLK